MNYMDSLSEVMAEIKKDGFEKEFRFRENKFQLEKEKSFSAEDLLITKVYRFEGESNPSDMSILYLIESGDGARGYFIDVYGAYSGDEEEDKNEFLKKIKRTEK